MAFGKRIKFFRKRSRLTLKALGMFVGFKKKGADVRIAQYESEYKRPKEKLVNDDLQKPLAYSSRRSGHRTLTLLQDSCIPSLRSRICTGLRYSQAMESPAFPWSDLQCRSRKGYHSIFRSGVM